MEELSPHNYRFLFKASGPDHMGIYISPGILYYIKFIFLFVCLHFVSQLFVFTFWFDKNFPVSGVKLTTWSFSNGELLEGPTWKDNRPTYYIFYSHGLAPTPWTFWLDFKVWNRFLFFLPKFDGFSNLLSCTFRNFFERIIIFLFLGS